VITVPFEKIPVKPQIYKDYIIGSPRVMKFYNGYYRSGDDFREIAAKVVRHDYHRDELTDVLRSTNEKFGMTPAIEANLQLLRDEKTVTVITGQQAGIYTGPLYTILKALSVLKVSTYLSKMLNVPVVPLFWMESSDHDLAEVNHIYFPGPQGPVNYVYGEDNNPKQQSVGSIQLGKDFGIFAERIKKILPKNDFYDATIRLMDETYYPGLTFGEAFGKMMSRLTGKYGLVMVDAEEVRLKRLAAPIIIRKLQDKGRMNELMLEQSKELEREDYERQIQVRTEVLNLFILKDNNRVPLDLLGRVLGNGDAESILGNKELLQIASENPERFSPKVAFRPIVQDFLFPTIAYIGGPSELAYFAQLKKVYEYFEIQMPIIWPRVSASLIDAKIQRAIHRTGISYADIFKDEDEIRNEIALKHMSNDPQKLFDEASIRMDELIDWLIENLGRIDTAIPSQIKTPANKMHYQLDSIKSKAFGIIRSKQDGLMKNWDNIRTEVFPSKKLQERVYNIIFYLSRYGLWLTDFVLDNIDIDNSEHQILEIPSR
jgi:bacillithiol synthase